MRDYWVGEIYATSVSFSDWERRETYRNSPEVSDTKEVDQELKQPRSVHIL